MKMLIKKLTIITALLIFFSIGVSAGTPSAISDDGWLSIQSKNFFLVGNAEEKDLRDVARKLEQFRESFRLIFPKAKFNQTIKTNVVVFRDSISYKPFLPKRKDGSSDTGVAGYFQPGEDVNYITLSTQSDSLTVRDTMTETYETVFHEYVHFLLNTNFGRSEIPPWFNEGLAEYYQTFKVEDNQKIFLGKLQNNHLFLLQRTKLIPLKTFFAIDNYSLHQNGNHSRSIFYAQAWALMHYLIQTKQSGNMSKFVSAVIADVEQEKAFRDAFGLDYEAMEKALEDYVKQKTFNITILKVNNKLLFDESMTVAKLPKADVNAYLGDLLYHTNEIDLAEPYLKKALVLDPNQSLANTALGLVKMKQGNFPEAKKHLQKAVASNQRNHYAHYNYAYVLSRESLDEFGRVTGYPEATAKIMRESLLTAININPNFTESYNLLAFINFVNNEELDQAVNYLNKAISLQPGNQSYNLRIAQIYLRQGKLDEAEKIASKIAKTAIEPDLRRTANGVLEGVKDYRKNFAEIENYKRDAQTKQAQFEEQNNIRKKSSLTPAEIEKIELENKIITLNKSLKETKPGEKQVVGYTQRIQCLRGIIKYTVKTEKGIISFTSKDFLGLDLYSLKQNTEDILVGCDAKIQNLKTIYTYLPGKNARLNTGGSLIRMTFVPNFFKLMTASELANAKYIQIIDDAEQKRSVHRSIRQNLPELKGNQKRTLGYLEKIECFRNFMFFGLKVNGQNLRLQTSTPNKLPLRVYSKEAAMLRFGCGFKPTPLKVVITYRPFDIEYNSSQGEIISLDFVPKDFTLEEK